VSTSGSDGHDTLLVSRAKLADFFISLSRGDRTPSSGTRRFPPNASQRSYRSLYGLANQLALSKIVGRRSDSPALILDLQPHPLCSNSPLDDVVPASSLYTGSGVSFPPVPVASSQGGSFRTLFSRDSQILPSPLTISVDLAFLPPPP